MKIKQFYVGLGAIAAVAAIIALANQAGLRHAMAQEVEQPAIQTQEEQLQTEQQLLNEEERLRPDLEATEELQEQTIRASQLIGMNVRVQDDDRNIGTIDDLVLSHEGEVLYVAVAHGGFLGIGDRLVAVPMDSLEIVQAEPGVFIDPSYARLDITEQQLRQMEGYERTADWPGQFDRFFDTEERHVERPAREPERR